MRTPDFWYARTPSAGASVLSASLAPLGVLFDALARFNRWMTTPMPAPVPVLCVGNLVAGGAGKTPTVIALAQMLRALGIELHILTRGFGAALSGPVQVDPRRHSGAEVGDEALLLARAAPTWIGADRRVTAQLAAEAGAKLLIMDDGFQNPGLRKDFSIVVVDGAVGIGNGRVLPAGPLREDPVRALSRADAVVVMGADVIGIGPRLVALASRPLPVFAARLVPSAEARSLAGQSVFAFAGIARPEKFFASLRAAGCVLAGTRAFPDHHSFRKSDLAALETRARDLGAKLVTTEKDAARLGVGDMGTIAIFPVEAVFDDPDGLLSLLSPLAARTGDGRT